MAENQSEKEKRLEEWRAKRKRLEELAAQAPGHKMRVRPRIKIKM